MFIAELKNIIQRIELKKNIIATERDELRKIHEELEDVINSFDAGIEGLDLGVLEINNAIDSISEVV
jgi:hypothetical protein